MEHMYSQSLGFDPRHSDINFLLGNRIVLTMTAVLDAVSRKWIISALGLSSRYSACMLYSTNKTSAGSEVLLGRTISNSSSNSMHIPLCTAHTYLL